MGWPAEPHAVWRRLCIGAPRPDVGEVSAFYNHLYGGDFLVFKRHLYKQTGRILKECIKSALPGTDWDAVHHTVNLLRTIPGLSEDIADVVGLARDTADVGATIREDYGLVIIHAYIGNIIRVGLLHPDDLPTLLHIDELNPGYRLSSLYTLVAGALYGVDPEGVHRFYNWLIRNQHQKGLSDFYWGIHTVSCYNTLIDVWAMTYEGLHAIYEYGMDKNKVSVVAACYCMVNIVNTGSLPTIPGCIDTIAETRIAHVKQCHEWFGVTTKLVRQKDSFWGRVREYIEGDEFTKHVISVHHVDGYSADLELMLGFDELVIREGEFGTPDDDADSNAVQISYTGEELTLDVLFYTVEPSRARVRKHGPVKWGALILALIDELAVYLGATKTVLSDAQTLTIPGTWRRVSGKLYLTMIRGIGYYEKYGYIPDYWEDTTDLLRYVNTTTVARLFAQGFDIPDGVPRSLTLSQAMRYLDKEKSPYMVDFYDVCDAVTTGMQSFGKGKKYIYKDGRVQVSCINIKTTRGSTISLERGFQPYRPAVVVRSWQMAVHARVSTRPVKRRRTSVSAQFRRLHI